jgi:hypothetical protein
MVDIKSDPIQEEDGDASAALANVAHTLRAVSDIPCSRILSDLVSSKLLLGEITR